MRKSIVSLIIVLSLIFATGCNIFNQNDGKKPSDRIQQSDKNINEENSKNEKEKQDGLNEAIDTDNQNNVDGDVESNIVGFENLVYLNKESLSKGIFKGLNIKTGMTMAEVEKSFGKPIESDYLQGGMYNLYELENYKLLLFDVDLGYVNHVMLYPMYNLKLQTVKEILGEGDYEGISDMYGNWSIVYYLGNYSFFVDGASEDANGFISRLFLKTEY